MRHVPDLAERKQRLAEENFLQSFLRAVQDAGELRESVAWRSLARVGWIQEFWLMYAHNAAFKFGF